MKLKEMVMVYFWVPSWHLPIGTEKTNEILSSDSRSRRPRFDSGLSECAGIATGYGMDGRGSTPGRARDFIYSTAPREALGQNKPPVQCLPGVFSPGVKTAAA
jgi:hypothetical protein